MEEWEQEEASLDAVVVFVARDSVAVSERGR